MPNHGKGGRRPERGQAKTAAVAVRTTPDIKAKIEAAAAEAGRSVTQEIEHRLLMSLAVPSAGVTAELLFGIVNDIRRAEELTGKHWHKDLRTWAMVREALASGEIEARAPEADRLLLPGESEAGELLAELNQYEERLRALAISANEMTGWPIPLNMYRLGDIRLPRFDYAGVRSKLEEYGSDTARSVVGGILDKMEAIEAERAPVAAEYVQQQKAVMECIDQAVQQWESDLQSRGRLLAHEYRPPSTLRPVRDQFGEPTGMWLDGQPDEVTAKYLPESGAPQRHNG